MLLAGVQAARDALEVRCSELKEWGSSYKKRGEEADEQRNKASMAIEKLTVSSCSLGTLCVPPFAHVVKHSLTTSCEKEALPALPNT